MNFLAPLFLVGAVGIALPVLAHLIRRSTRQRTLFSSLLLLQASPPRMRRRSRLEDLLLLALRCLVLGLLAFGFARPYLRHTTFATPPPAPAQRVVLLVDASGSMQREGLWKTAVEHAVQQARSLAPGDQLSLVTFARESRTLVTFEAWDAATPDQRAALVGARLQESGPGWTDTHLANALIAATDTLTERADDAAGIVRRVVLISDLQEGGHLEPLQAYEWPKTVGVRIDRLAAPHRGGNAAVQLLTDAPAVPGATNLAIRVRVANTTDATTDTFELGWARGETPGFVRPPQSVQVPPGGSRIVSVPVPAEAGADRLLLRGDAEPFDNTTFVVPPAAQRLDIVHAGEDAGTDPRQPLFFLRRAFPGTNGTSLTVVSRRSREEFTAGDARAALVVATDALPEAYATGLHDVARAGGTVLFAPRRAGPEVAATLGRLLGRDPVPVTEAAVRNYAMVSELDFQHPVLSAFADPRFSDFTKIHFWHHRRVDAAAIPGAHIIGRFDSGDPAWVEVPVGSGRVFLMASGWHPDDSQSAVSTKFVPLLCAVMESGGASVDRAPRSYRVGDALPLPAVAGPQARLRLPDGSTAVVTAGATNYAATMRPGIYTFTPAEGATPVRFAVNLDPAESRTAPLAQDEFERLGLVLQESAPEAQRSAERTAEIAAAEVENRQKLWRTLLVVALGFIFLESALAGWMARRLAASPSATPSTGDHPAAPA